MRKLRNIEPAKLNRIRLWVLIISLLTFYLILSIQYFSWLKFFTPNAAAISLLIVCLSLLAVFLYRRDTVNKTIKRVLIVMLIASGIFAIAVLIVDKFFYKNLLFEEYWFLRDTSLAIVVAVCILFYIIYIHRINLIIPGLLILIVIGLILNRFGMEDDAGAVLILGFLFLGISIIYAGIRSFKDYKGNSFIGWIFFSLALILTFCITTFLVKFSMWEAAHTSTLDFFGAVFFLVACLLLFVSMPFSNFIEWTRRQKQFFYHLFLIPMLFLLILFSLKFLLPGNAYQKLFFEGYTEMEKVYFGMDKYRLDEDTEGRKGKD